MRNIEFVISIELKIITVHSKVGVRWKRFDRALVHVHLLNLILILESENETLWYYRVFSLVLPVSLLTVFRSLFEQANKQKYSRFS